MTLQLGISARDRRTLIAGITVIGSLVTLARGLPWLLTWQRDRVGEARSVLDEARAADADVRTLPMYRDSLVARKARLARFDSTMLSGQSASEAAAELASALGDMTDAAPIRVSSMQLRADSAAPGTLAPVAVRVTGVTDVVGLATFLRSVESGDTPLLVRELSVTQPDPASPDQKIENLRVDILVEGLARIERALSRKAP